MCFSPQIHPLFRHQNFKKLSAADVFCTFSFQNLLFATTVCNFSTSELLKCSRTLFFFFEHFDFKMCFAPQRRAIFRRLNFKKRSRIISFFARFDFKMCCTPQRRAIFRHLNLKKRSRTFIFFLHVLTSKCASRHSAKFSTSELQKVFPGPHLFEFKMCFRPQRRAIFRHQNFKKCSEPDMFFYIFTSKSAFRYSGVQFLISPVTT